MNDHTLASRFGPRATFSVRDPLAVIGLLVGIALPLAAALLYPTYTYTMATGWVEWTRLLEMPFVLSEIAVIFWALNGGLQPGEALAALPRDVKYALILLGLGCTLSSVFISKHPADSLTISIFTFVHLMFLMSVHFMMRISSRIDPVPFLRLLGIGLGVLALMTAIKFAFPPRASSVFGGVIMWPNALPGFISVRHFGAWTGAVCAAFAAILLSGTDRRPFWIYASYFLSAAMTIWSGTRAAIFAIAISALITVAINRRIPATRSLAILASLTGAAATLAWLLLPYDDPAFQLFLTRDYGNSDFITSGRLALWTATYGKWLESPLLGWGSGSIFWEVFVGWRHTQPHNFILQCLVSWGLVGATGALWLLGRAILAVHRRTLRNHELLPLLAILNTLLVQSMLEGMLHYPRFIMLIMTMFAVILAHEQEGRAAR